MIKILQAADLHLDKPFGKLPNEKAKTLKNELRFALHELMQVVKEKKADILLLPGDILDHAYASEETARVVSSAFAEVDCPVVVSPGNHDYYMENGFWQKTEWPSNVHIFQKENLEVFSFDQLQMDVYGYAFCHASMDKSPFEGVIAPEDGRLHIACVHADLDGSSTTYAPLSTHSVERSKFTYVAMGHIHAPKEPVLSLEGNAYGYSGALVGHAMDECGKKGALLITIQTEPSVKVLSIEKVPISRYHFETVDLSVDGAKNMWTLFEKWKEVKKTLVYDEYTFLTVNLTGEAEPGWIFDSSLLVQEGGPWFYLAVEDHTLLKKDRTYLETDQSVRGEFYRLLKEKMASTDSRERRIAEHAFSLGLAAIEGTLGKL